MSDQSCSSILWLLMAKYHIAPVTGESENTLICGLSLMGSQGYMFGKGVYFADVSPIQLFIFTFLIRDIL